MNIVFDVAHLYYLPQFLPVYRELARRGVTCLFIFHTAMEDVKILRHVIDQEGLPYEMVSNDEQAYLWYQNHRPDWIIFGNWFPQLFNLPKSQKTALLYHGIGVKQCYYDWELVQNTVRFVEGNHRLQGLQRRYPQANLVDAGFAKLDPLFNSTAKPFNLAAAGLDETRQTILYAPTFYPSSLEKLPNHWPELLADKNIIIKPHQFSLIKDIYYKQRKKIEGWERYGNVYTAKADDYNLVPFMDVADILVSEASSALFEFAVLDKPIVWCDFFKLRWGYRGPLRFRFTRRMDKTIDRYRDIGAHARKPRDIADVIRAELAQPARFSAKRRDYTGRLLGRTDGQVSQRIADYLQQRL